MKFPGDHEQATLEEIERTLLQAGRASAPAEAKRRAFAAGAGVLGGSALTGTSAAATGIAGKTAAIVYLKWVAVVGLSGLAAASGIVAAKRLRAERIESSPPVTATTAAPPAKSAMASQVPSTAPVASAPSSEAIAATTSRPSPSAASSASAGSSFPVELALMDGARAAIAAGDPAKALSMLDGYSERFPRGAMAPEAAVLRVEALVAAGDRDAARRAGDAFLRSHPSSPYGPRIQSLLGTNP
jgi:hypothetical protein